VDVGIAGICAAKNTAEPAAISLSDLDEASKEMEDAYYSGLMTSYLSCVFMNSSFVQPGEKASTRQAFLDDYVRAHRRLLPDPLVAGLRCVFSGLPATTSLVRTHLPLFSGEGVINFRPVGQSFVPAAGPFVTALLFCPLASRRTEGRMLVVHSEDAALQVEVARTFLSDNRRILGLMRSGSHSAKALVDPSFTRERPAWDAAKKKAKFPDAKGAKSLVISDLVELASKADVTDLRDTALPITVLTLSSSGQGPAVDQFEVPGNLVRFLQRASVHPKAGIAWKRVLQRFRNVSTKDGDSPADENAQKAKKGARSKAKASPIAGRAGWSKNSACEDLFAIFEGGFVDEGVAAKWLRRYVLGRPDAYRGRVNTSVVYRATGARSWPLAELILKELLGMHESRIKAIKDFSFKIADHINAHHATRLLKAFLLDGRYHIIRRSLINAQKEGAKSGEALFGLEEYARVWHAERDEYLVRDLVSIGIIERLTEKGYFSAHPEEVLPEVADLENSPDPTEEKEENAE